MGGPSYRPQCSVNHCQDASLQGHEARHLRQLRFWCFAVAVAVDSSCSSARSAFCEVAGVELSTAPKRTTNSRTVITKSLWIPYGERTIAQPEKTAYVHKLGALLHKALLPELEPAESMPSQLKEVRRV